MITIHVPAMTARQDVRAISARISDIPGVQTLKADLATRTVQVKGSVALAAVTAAVTAAGYAVTSATDDPPASAACHRPWLFGRGDHRPATASVGCLGAPACRAERPEAAPARRRHDRHRRTTSEPTPGWNAPAGCSPPPSAAACSVRWPART